MNEQHPLLIAEQRKRFLIALAYMLALVALAALLCRYALGTLLPFLIAWIVAAILRPAFRFFREKSLRLHKAAGIAMIILFYLVILFLGIILFDRLLDAAVSFLTSIPQIWNNLLMPVLQLAGEKITELFSRFDVELRLSISELLASAGKTVTSYSAQLLGKAGNIAISLPGMLVNAVICVVSTIYILLDWEMIRDFIYRQLPHKAAEIAEKASSQLRKTLWQYIRSYGLIMLVTFLEISVGLLLAGIENSFLIGALIALLDILPIVGSGVVLLPWALVSLIAGNIRRGLFLAALYLFVTIVRNVIEPKLVGKQVGLHPLVTLLSMIIGNSFFGGAGVLACPVSIAVIKQLDDDGVIHLLKRAEKK